MRILYIIHQFYPEFASGTERVAFELAKAAQRDGHYVEVLTCTIKDKSLWPSTDGDGFYHSVIDGVPVYALPHAGGTDARTQLGFGRVASQREVLGRFLTARTSFDIAHVVHSMRMVDVVEALADHRIPYLLTLTDFFAACYRVNLVRLSGRLCPGPAGGENCVRHCSTSELDRGALVARQHRLKRVLFSAAAVVACSQSVADVFREEYPELRMFVVEHGIDLLRFGPPRPHRTGNVVFGYLGTLSNAKGAHVLAEAFVQAAPPGARLELVGPAHDEPFRKLLSELTADNIVIRAPVAAKQVPETLAGFDVFCLPSLVPETFSLAMHESFAAGVPCLVSDLGHPARVVRQHGCGGVVAAGDVAAWRDIIRSVSADSSILLGWRDKLPLPRRVEEEGFLYGQLYRAILTSSVPAEASKVAS